MIFITGSGGPKYAKFYILILRDLISSNRNSSNRLKSEDHRKQSGQVKPFKYIVYKFHVCYQWNIIQKKGKLLNIQRCNSEKQEILQY
jgi:hypothetical protein